MFAALLPLLGLGVPKFLTGPLKWLVDVGIIVVLLAGLWALHGHWERAAYNAAYNAGWSALAKSNSDAAAKALKVNDAAKDKAAAERVNDTAAISTKQDERNVAISAAPPSSTGAATRSLGCVRWKQQHPSTAHLPAGC